MPDLSHLTSTTGHVQVSVRDDVDRSEIDVLLPIARADGGSPGDGSPLPPGWHVDIWPFALGGGAAVFQVAPGRAETARGKQPYVMACACWRDELRATAWREGAQHLASLVPAAMAPNRLPAEPPPVPWLTVVVFPGALSLPPEQLVALGAFERCLTWALMDVDHER